MTASTASSRTSGPLPYFEGDERERRVVWAFGQSVFTPEDIRDPNPPRDVWPYSGILYLDTELLSRGEKDQHLYSLRLGWVGPGPRSGGPDGDPRVVRVQ